MIPVRIRSNTPNSSRQPLKSNYNPLFAPFYNGTTTVNATVTALAIQSCHSRQRRQTASHRSISTPASTACSFTPRTIITACRTRDWMARRAPDRWRRPVVAHLVAGLVDRQQFDLQARALLDGWGRQSADERGRGLRRALRRCHERRTNCWPVVRVALYRGHVSPTHTQQLHVQHRDTFQTSASCSARP